MNLSLCNVTKDINDLWGCFTCGLSNPLYWKRRIRSVAAALITIQQKDQWNNVLLKLLWVLGCDFIGWWGSFFVPSDLKSKSLFCYFLYRLLKVYKFFPRIDNLRKKLANLCYFNCSLEMVLITKWTVSSLNENKQRDPHWANSLSIVGGCSTLKWSEDPHWQHQNGNISISLLAVCGWRLAKSFGDKWNMRIKTKEKREVGERELGAVLHLFTDYRLQLVITVTKQWKHV